MGELDGLGKLKNVKKNIKPISCNEEINNRLFIIWRYDPCSG
jgi:hypothetical protein